MHGPALPFRPAAQTPTGPTRGTRVPPLCQVDKRTPRPCQKNTPCHNPQLGHKLALARFKQLSQIYSFQRPIWEILSRGLAISTPFWDGFSVYPLSPRYLDTTQIYAILKRETNDKPLDLDGVPQFWGNTTIYFYNIFI